MTEAPTSLQEVQTLFLLTLSLNKYRNLCTFVILYYTGLGGIGFETAKWMIDQGARNLILVGRKPPSDSVQEIITSLVSCTNQLQIISMEADVGKMEDCRRVFSSIISANLPPLRGIFHAAGNISDAILPNQTWDKFRECFGPKVDGTWNLHSLSLELKFPLDHFVLYSSIVALFGLPGQAR
jgi:myxalamid-type polyketide synthase MxaB